VGGVPVPLPSADDTLLTPPDDQEVSLVWRAIVAANAPEVVPLSPLQDLLARAVTTSMTGREDLPDPTPLSPVDFAQGLSRRNREFRERVMQVAMLVALVRRPPAPEAMARVAAFCDELSLDGQLAEITHGFADGGFELAVSDFDRNGYLAPAGEGGATGASPLVDGGTGSVWSPRADDPALAASWVTLGDLPAGTIGRSVHDFYRARGFAFPGTAGSVSPLLAQHDWVHVLADYGTTLESELEVFGFIARANDDPRAFSLLAMVVSLFETGTVASGLGIFQASPGNLGKQGMAVRLADALRRGALTPGSNDFLGVDWFALADRPLEVVRAELGLPPRSARAVAAGTRGPWQQGGISAYQVEQGRRAAEAHGWDYDALAAPPA
jgi:hypothetical protein